MQWQEIPYQEYLDLPIVDFAEVRRFGNCVVMTAILEGKPLLILEEPWQRVTLCQYQDANELANDIRFLLTRKRGQGGGGALETGVPEPPSPLMPSPSDEKTAQQFEDEAS